MIFDIYTFDDSLGGPIPSINIASILWDILAIWVLQGPNYENHLGIHNGGNKCNLYGPKILIFNQNMGSKNRWIWIRNASSMKKIA